MMRDLVIVMVVDPDFGERLRQIAAQGPLWIADTPANRPAAEAVRRDHPGPPSNEGVTTFRVDATQSPEQWVIDILPKIELHYGAYDDNPPMYDALEVWGAQLSAELRDFLTGSGYGKLTARPGGFRATHNAAGLGR